MHVQNGTFHRKITIESRSLPQHPTTHHRYTDGLLLNLCRHDFLSLCTDACKFQVRTLRLNVVFTATNAVNLHELVPGMTFDRIDVSNIMDAVYLGVPTTLESVRPLLRPDSKYATVISLFMNAIGIMQQKNRLSVSIDTLLKASQFLPVNPMQLNPHDPKFLRMSASQDMLVPFDAWFKEYMEIAEFKEAAREFQMMMKSQNTIIQKWPYRLKKKLGETGAQDEFDKLLASSWTGAERYVEWRLS